MTSINENYYLPSGPLHEHNRIMTSTMSSTPSYLSYEALPDYSYDKPIRKPSTKSRSEQSKKRNMTSKNKTQITEREAKEAIMRGLVTETDDIDVTKLSGTLSSITHRFALTTNYLFS